MHLLIEMKEVHNNKTDLTHSICWAMYGTIRLTNACVYEKWIPWRMVFLSLRSKDLSYKRFLIRCGILVSSYTNTRLCLLLLFYSHLIMAEYVESLYSFNVLKEVIS